MTAAFLHPSIESLISARPVVLVFLPGTRDVQRFVLSGAFKGLAGARRLHYVLPVDVAQAIRDTTRAITQENSTPIDVPRDRCQKWSEIFEAACVQQAHLSPSLARRAGLQVNPAWRQAWAMPPDERVAIDCAFESAVEASLDGMRPLPAIEELFERFMPVYCIVPTSLADPFCNEVVWACEAADVPCVLLQSGWDDLSSNGRVYGRTALLGCWGPQSRKYAAVLQRIPRRRTELMGAPHCEPLRQTSMDEVNRLRTALGVRGRERLLLFGGGRQFDEIRVLRHLEDAIAEGRLRRTRVVYRPHPWRARRPHDASFFDFEWSHVVIDPEMRDRYLREQAEQGYLERHAPMFDMAHLSTLLCASDAVVSSVSTLLVESLIADRPTMAIGIGDSQGHDTSDVTLEMTHLAELRESVALRWCFDIDQLIESCAELLRGRRHRWQTKARAKALDLIVTSEPGTYAERLAEFCRSRVEIHGRKKRARRTGVKRHTISHSYGAHVVARDYCRLGSRDLVIPGYWMHGWFPAYHNVHPTLIAHHKKTGQLEGYDFETQIREEKETTPQWVGRPDQADFLTRHGYQRVKTIGLPITYVPPPPVERVPGALLVMPPHSHRNHGPDDPVAERYAEMISAIRSRFEHVWVGLTDDDIARDQWVESFRRRGVDVFTTTDPADPYALNRLRRILSTFEYVTTNGFGSHIAIAAYCGAKVSVWGPYAEFPRERVRRTHGVKMFPELLDEAYYLCSEEALRAHYPFLFVEPDRAVLHLDWGAHEVGEPWHVSPPELMRLFGWEERLGAEVA
jgi:hypothetical protein